VQLCAQNSQLYMDLRSRIRDSKICTQKNANFASTQSCFSAPNAAMRVLRKGRDANCAVSENSLTVHLKTAPISATFIVVDILQFRACECERRFVSKFDRFIYENQHMQLQQRFSIGVPRNVRVP